MKRRSGQICVKNFNKADQTMNSQANYHIKPIYQPTIFSYNVQASQDLISKHNDDGTPSDTIRTVIKSQTKSKIFSDFQQQTFSKQSISNQISIRSDNFAKKNHKQIHRTSHSHKQSKVKFQEKSINEMSKHSQMQQHLSKQCESENSNFQKISKCSTIKDKENKHIKSNSQSNQASYEVHNIHKYIYNKQSQVSVQNQALSNLQQMIKKQDRQGVYKYSSSKYVSSDIGNGNQCSLYGDSLAVYENPLVRNQQIVKKLSIVNNIFQNISKLKQQKISRQFHQQLKNIQGELLTVEKGILRN